MSEDESKRAANEEQGDEVELHGHGKLKAANDEEARKSEFDEGDDVEAHGHGFRKQGAKKL
jgi:hypothetical protein